MNKDGKVEFQNVDGCAIVEDFDINKVCTNWLHLRETFSSDRIRSMTAGMLLETAINLGQSIPEDSQLFMDSGWEINPEWKKEEAHNSAYEA